MKVIAQRLIMACLAISMFVLIMAFDYQTKTWASAKLEYGTYISTEKLGDKSNPIIDPFVMGYKLIHNEMSYFATAASWVYFSFYGVVVLFMGFLMIKAFIDRAPARLIATTLVISGATGNTIDRFVNGYVVEFMLFDPEGAYMNVADLAVFTGLTLLLLTFFYRHNPTPV